MGLIRLLSRPPYSVDFAEGAGTDLVISFSSVGHDPTRPPAPEFLATATGRGTPAAPRRALFISDDSRSWASDPGFAPMLTEALARLDAPVTRIATLGLSMGAFSALAAAQVLPVDAVLAFSPQFSPLPGRIAGETRWAEWTARLTAPRWPEAPLPAHGAAWLFHGMIDDTAQALSFPRAPGTEQILFTEESHASLVPHLKRKGALAGLLEAALAGDRRRLLRIASACGGQRRDRAAPRP